MPHDNAPVGNTCGTIDDAISLMNDVRGDNASLREWGNDLHEQLTDMECERDQALADVEKLEDQIEDLKAEIEHLKEIAYNPM